MDFTISEEILKIAFLPFVVSGRSRRGSAEKLVWLKLKQESWTAKKAS